MTKVLPQLLPPVLLATLVVAAHWAWSRLPVSPMFAVIGPRVLDAAAWSVLAWLVVRIADVLFDRTARRRGLIQAPRFLHDLTRVVAFGATVTVILAFVLRQPVAGLLATSGVLIAVLGFALRNMIADVFSGIALNVEHPYRIGDWIELGPGMVGRVDEINWRATRLTTNDGTAIIVPNGLVAGSRFINHSFPNHECRAALRITLDHGVPVARARRVLLTGALCASRILARPRPDVVVEAITDQGVTYLVRYWLPDFGQEAACRDDIATAVLRSLHHAGIKPARSRHDLVPVRRRAEAEPMVAAVRRLLAQIDLFEAFDPAELDRLAAAMHPRHVAEGTTVVRQNEPGHSLFVIAEGMLEVTLMSAERPALCLDRMTPGEVFGEMSLLTGQPRSASVVAVTDALVYELDKDTMDPLLRRRPELAESLAELMARRQQRNVERRCAEGRPAPPSQPASSAQDLLRRLRGFFKLPA